MSTTHFTASFRNSCVIQPRNPHTKLPNSLLERESIDFANRIGTEIRPTNSSKIIGRNVKSREKVLNFFEASSTAVNRFRKRSVDENEEEFQNENEENRLHQTSQEDLKNLINDDDKFFDHLQALKAENKKTLMSLEKLYNMSSNNSYTHPSLSQNSEIYYRALSKSTSGEKRHRSSEKKRRKDERRNLIGENLNESIKQCNKDLLLASFDTEGDAVEQVQPDVLFEEQSDIMDYENYGKYDDDDERPRNTTHNEVEFIERSQEYSSDDLDDDLDEQLKVKAPESHVNILPDEYHSSFRGRSSSFDVIANMWENFSVDEYAPYTSRTKDRNKQKQWSPTITIPEPFQMTVRDESKAKRKSKRIEKIEQEKLEKRLLEEMELQKRIRPTPIPPSTFLPMYEEIFEKEDKRRKYTRELSKKILQSTEKPFSFVKREEVKNEMRKARSMSDIRKQQKAEKDRKKFKANPFPDKLFDLTWADKLAEQEEYRKIKIKLRAEETLAGSSLPINMKTRAGTAKYFKSGEKTKRTKEELKKRKQKSFHPEVHHDIPDFEDLHRKFEQELEQRKTGNPLTVCEPFQLQTGKIPERRSKFTNSIKAKELEQSLSRDCGRRQDRFENSGNRSRSLSGSRVSHQTPPSYSHTETSKLRQERLRQSLEKTKQEELRLSIKLNKKRKELNELQKSVAKKAIAQDPARNRKKENKEKLEMFRMADSERRKDYKEYLHDVNSNLKNRPLLFEREAQVNARVKAQKRYEEILREAGIEGNTLDSFLQGDVNEDENYGDKATDDETYSDDDGSDEYNDDNSEYNDDNDSDSDSDGSYVQKRERDLSKGESDDGITEDDNGGDGGNDDDSNDGSYIVDRTSSFIQDDEV